METRAPHGAGTGLRPAGGPLPFRQFILKLHSRCNLACEHCYVYTMADQRWLARPRVMSDQVIDQTAARLAEHVHKHRLAHVSVVLHGGEPLLAGAGRLVHCVTAIRAAVGDRAQVDFTMQTNGTLLTRTLLEVLRDLDVRVGVSVDGGQTAHDRHRQRADGRGSYTAVAKGLKLLREDHFRSLFAGLLCTIDVRNDPLDVYRALLEFAPPTVDFLLPHGNWTEPPPSRVADPSMTPYADWLIAVFDYWYGAPRLATRVRFFEEILAVVLGGSSRVEGVGLSPVRMIVVETDGGIEQSDMLASAYEGAGATGLHVATNSFDEALRHPGVVARQLGAAGLPTACRGCPVRRICGGGLHVHRYHQDGTFDHPSVYCPDLFRLIHHVRRRVVTDLATLGGKSS